MNPNWRSGPDTENSSMGEKNELLDVGDLNQEGTPAAALVNAIFAEDVDRCRQLLWSFPDLANIPLRINIPVSRNDSSWGYTWEQGDCYQRMPPVVFASMIPKFKEHRRYKRSFSQANLDVLKLLIEHGARLESHEGRDQWTSYLLMEICRDYDSPDALEALTSIGANLHTGVLDTWNHTLFQVAAARGSAGSVGFLLDNGVPMNHMYAASDVRCYGEIDGTPLHQAAKHARDEMVELLLGRGGTVDMEKRDHNGNTPLLLAAKGQLWLPSDEDFLSKERRERTIRVLIEAGADLKAEGPLNNVTPDTVLVNFMPDSVLGHVASWGGADIIRYLVVEGSDPHEKRPYRLDKFFAYNAGGEMVTPLHKAAHAWNADGVEALLDLGANPTAADQCGRLPLHWAAMGRYLLDDYYSDGQLSNDSYGRFSVAWVDGMARPETLARLTMLATQKAAIRHLILRKASINKRDNYGRTPMHYAARMKLIGAVKLFLAHGADPTLSDMEGRTVLHELVHPFIGCFDHHGPLDRDIEDKELCSLLCVRVERADANHRDESGNTALHIATRYFSDTAVALLLHLGADPNFLDSKGSAPLHLAARRAMWVHLGTHEPEEYTEWIDRAQRIHGMLIAAGADVGLRDREGRNAAEIMETGRKELCARRERYMQTSLAMTMARHAARERELASARPMGRGAGQPRFTGMGRGRMTLGFEV